MNLLHCVIRNQEVKKISVENSGQNEIKSVGFSVRNRGDSDSQDEDCVVIVQK
jgi:hypothetical protein